MEVTVNDQKKTNLFQKLWHQKTKHQEKSGIQKSGNIVIYLFLVLQILLGGVGLL